MGFPSAEGNAACTLGILGSTGRKNLQAMSNLEYHMRGSAYNFTPCDNYIIL